MKGIYQIALVVALACSALASESASAQSKPGGAALLSGHDDFPFVGPRNKPDIFEIDCVSRDAILKTVPVTHAGSPWVSDRMSFGRYGPFMITEHSGAWYGKKDMRERNLFGLRTTTRCRCTTAD